jgi:2-octaprenyl-3-methyl-6-methoxy-1,4-benzoquinol hydroxylase
MQFDPSENSYDIVIVGAGMVGATVACGLADSGLKIALIENTRPRPFIADEIPHIRVSALNLASEQILRNLGVWPFLEAMRLCPYRRLAVNEKAQKRGLLGKLPDISGWARTEFNSASVGRSHLGHIVENDLVQHAFYERIAQHDALELICPANIKSFHKLELGYQLVLDSGKTLNTKLVVGADGAQSLVRQHSDIGQYQEQYEQHAYVMMVSYDGDQQDITWQSFRPEGPLAFLPLARSGDVSYASLVWYDSVERIKNLKSLDNNDLLDEVKRCYPKALPRLLAMHTRASFPLYKSHAKTYVQERVVLVGDAAHTINPLAGQGVNLGFMDAAVLVDVVGRALLNGEDYASSETLAAYEKQRRGYNQLMMNAMDAFYYGFSNKHLPLYVARNVGLGLAQSAGFAKNKVTEFATGMVGSLPRLAQFH